MKIVFFGTPPFASYILDALIAGGHDIVAVVSRPDKSKGRSGTPVPTPIKSYLQTNSFNIPIHQPEKCSTPEFAETLRSYKADIFIVVAYGEIIKQDILDIPPYGCINVHASLLPKLRGAAPIQRAIINSEKETGVTIMHMVRKMDAGDMISRTVIKIEPEMTFGELEEAMMRAAAPLLLATIKTIAEGTAQREQQDEAAVTFAPKIELEDCEIDWNRSAQEIHDLIRGVNPYPGAWTFMKLKGEKKRVKIFCSKVTESTGMVPGTINCGKTALIVYCGDHSIEILELQVEGKRAMKAVEFLRGYSQGQLETDLN